MYNFGIAFFGSLSLHLLRRCPLPLPLPRPLPMDEKEDKVEAAVCQCTEKRGHSALAVAPNGRRHKLYCHQQELMAKAIIEPKCLRAYCRF